MGEYGGLGIDGARKAFLNRNGDLVIGGSIMSGQGLDVSEATRGDYDMWMIKVDTLNGNPIMDKRYGSSNIDHMYTMVEDSAGDIYWVGNTEGPPSGDLTQAAFGSRDILVLKTDANGNLIWERRFGTSDLDYSVDAVIVSGGIVIGGGSYGGIEGSKSEISRGDGDIWLIKIDPNGNQVWDKTLGGSGDEDCWGITVDCKGNLILGSYSDSGIGGEKSEAQRGAGDYWMIWTDPNGNLIQEKTLGGSMVDWFTDVNIMPDGSYLAAGVSQSSQNGEKSESSRGFLDMWIVRMDIKADFNQSADTVCLGETINFTDLSNTLTQTWAWDFGDGNGSTQTSPAHFFSAPGTYTVRQTVQRDCLEPDFFERQVTILPQQGPPTFRDTLICDPLALIIGSAPLPGFQYLWSPQLDNGGPIDNPLQAYLPESDGVYILNWDNGFCSGADTFSIDLMLFEADLEDTAFCPGDSLLLTITAEPTASFQWQPAFLLDDPFSQSPMFVTDSGLAGQTFPFQVNIQYGYCQKTESATVTVYPEPTADFSAQPLTAETATPITFINQSLNASQFEWDMADGTIYSTFSPVHAYAFDGIYPVWLVAQNQFGCKDSTALEIEIKSPPLLFMPNAFTPNGDGLNDHLTYWERNMGEFKLLIFNRFGQIIFSTNSPLEYWDGNFQGKPAQEGLYLWKVVAKTIYGEDFRASGSVLILR